LLRRGVTASFGESRASDGTRRIAGAAHEPHQRAITPDRAAADEMQSGNTRLKTIGQDWRAIKNGNLLQQIGRENAKPRNVDSEPVCQNDMIVLTAPLV
jgi:hypothetical protein